MEYAVISHPGDKRIMMSGQFTFSDNGKFKQILEFLSEEGMRNVTLDFSGVDFIDSAGLGMMLLLRDECHSRGVGLSICGAQGQVRKIFLISKFDQLFSMHDVSSAAGG